MKRILFLVFALILLTFTGCREVTTETVPAETLPSETEVTSWSVDDFTEYYRLLDYSDEERNWIFLTMGCIFSSPEEIQLDYLFYLGVDYGGWEAISDESRQSLLEQEFMYEMDLQVMPVDTLDGILQKTFGISLSDATIPDAWGYIQAENAYCSNNNDAYFPSQCTISAITEYSDGTVEICYTVDYFCDARTGEFFENPTLVLKLFRTEAGNWLVRSNEFA